MPALAVPLVVLLLGNPQDVAIAVRYAVIQRINVNIGDFVVRSPKSFDVAR
ncbi:MAG: hypothetical protein GWP50_02015 [Proteobacteria bacterium]|nr:hypothetical protein [Pseudomonadota bacterium]